MGRSHLMLFVSLVLCLAPPAQADGNSPWGAAPVATRHYEKLKVVFDVTSSSPAYLASVLDRASYLSSLNGTDAFDGQIVLVIHGDAISLFGAPNFSKYKALMQRAQSLSVGDVVDFRMCQLAAKSAGFTARDIHGFVTMVPMGDAEIIQLQQQGFAYMR
jgi:intracellular sulfur oxidation DsrE/DsrF family protein